ncbi:hypothetical protein N0V84_009339 [Fusarium piperis]|uniref:Uncharacterized protein n=1 Tax=Fusarium piperis TaxID=1435070 RepID=A0A9W8W6I1_9HYPO|nr:hypothetical protein N0V84_009339 [Fusarium piperis]
MAAEDGALLGKLLGLFNKAGLLAQEKDTALLEVLQLYEGLRKARTTVNVKGATSNRHFYHLPDGPLQESRDAHLLSAMKGAVRPDVTFANPDYMRAMLASDVVGEGAEAFKK